MRLIFPIALIAALAIAGAFAQEAKKDGKKAPDSPLGYDDTPYLPDGKWRVHDIKRPRPHAVTPGASYGQPPSDAIVLFDGKDLSKWQMSGRGDERVAPAWKVENGYFEVVPGTGHLLSREKFGDVQYHIEWASPAEVRRGSQFRGNSGILIMERYEVQVLDSSDNPTYADGQAGAMYGQYPPLVNAARKPGEWQAYDIIFEAPRFDGDKLVKPAYVTVLHNGIVLHHRQAFIGRMAHKLVGTYAPHGAEESLMLQNHGDQVRYRNIWVRKLGVYDRP